MRNISKTIFLNSLACPTLGWLLRNSEAKQTELSLGDKFRIEQGIEVGERARTLYPHGLLIDDVSTEAAAAKTKKAIANIESPEIFEATFIFDDFVAKADILKQDGDRWRIIEVKSSINDKAEFIDDMAYTTLLANRCGLDISGASLLLMSKAYRLGLDNKALFVELDHTDKVLQRATEFKDCLQEINDITGSKQKPETKLQFECRKCQLFGECFVEENENHIFDLPRLSKSKFDQLNESNVLRIEDIHDDFPLTEKQIKVRDAVKTNKPIVGDTLTTELDLISWPAYYLDFETVMTAIPLYPEIAPYTQIPTQFSAHKCASIGDVVEHFDYLADPKKDCRLELAECLISNIKGEGSIIVYSSFEKTVINSLATLFPHLSDQLKMLVERMVDLEAIIRKHFYHPGFHGSTSIKKTLPALVSDMTYDGMPIAEGNSAVAAFAYLASGKYEGSEFDDVIRNLLDYCKQDTLAMVKLHEELARFE